MSGSRIEQYRAYLDRTGYRKSINRLRVAQFILSLPGPYDGVRIYEKLVSESPEKRPSRSTVYRVLKQLNDAGLIRLED